MQSGLQCIRLMAFSKIIWILVKKQMMIDGVAVASAEHIKQIMCTLLHTDNRISSSTLNLYRPDALSDA